MPKIAYVKNRFQKSTLDIIEKVNRIIEEWQSKGWKLTIRQIYYRLISLDLIPDSWIDDEYNAKQGLPKGTKNTLRNYKRLIDILVIGRKGGLVDWSAIEDRTRALRGLNHWDSTADYLSSIRYAYRNDKWKGQKVRFELWFEKDALIGIAEHIATQDDIDIQFFSSRGYSSETAMWNAAQRINWYREKLGIETIILQFSDHDPSGIDIARFVQDQFDEFLCPVKVQRMALTLAQVKKFNLPPNPAKENDIRFAGYVEKFGKSSWEMDALEPDYMEGLVRKVILKHRDAKDWEKRCKIEETHKHLMKGVRVPKFGFGRFKKYEGFPLSATMQGDFLKLAEELREHWRKAGSPKGRVNIGAQFIFEDQSPETHRHETKKKGGKKK